MMVRLKVIPHNDNFIFLMPEFAAKLRRRVSVSFGGKTIGTQVLVHDNNDADSQSFLSEATTYITISSSLKNQLLIQESVPYQIKIYPSKIVIGPVIGLLLGDKKSYYNMDFLNRNCDRLTEYHKIGGLICAFSCQDINFGNKTVYGYYYNGDKLSWQRGRFPIPDVVYRRNFHVDLGLIERLRELTNDRVFNSYRFTKYELYEYLQERQELNKHLPPTELCQDIHQVKQFIGSYSSVILKPNDLSRGRGICVIEKKDSGYKVFDYRKQKIAEYELSNEKSLIDFLISSEFFNYNYIMQKYIPLASIDGYPYDVRVVMQKVRKDEWKFMGTECRVSQGSLITNISRGGYATWLEIALALSFEDIDFQEVKDKILKICHKICNYMDESGEHYGEFGIDIGIDEEKNIWIIEVNVLPSYNGFKDLDLNVYLSLRSNPLSYAFSLTEFEDCLDRRI